jgi:hypothetical protein
MNSSADARVRTGSSCASAETVTRGPGRWPAKSQSRSPAPSATDLGGRQGRCAPRDACTAAQHPNHSITASARASKADGTVPSGLPLEPPRLGRSRSGGRRIPRSDRGERSRRVHGDRRLRPLHTSGIGTTSPMRQQCGGPVTIHRRESENQTVANRSFCHQIGTPAALREERGAVRCRGRAGLSTAEIRR